MKSICNTSSKIYVKPKICCFSIKRLILPICFCLFTVGLVVFSKSNLAASKEGLALWASHVVPSLLPFFMATELLSHTDVIYTIGRILNPIMRPIFRVPGHGAYALIMGIISGYPVGAKIVTQFRENHLCTKAEAERLLAFTNNSGPLFIIGTVGISLFGNHLVGLLLFITHILSCFTVGFLFRFWKRKEKGFENSFSTPNTDTVSFSNLGEVLSQSIFSAVKSVIMVGGFVVLFSVILSILSDTHFLALGSKLLSPILNLFGISDGRFSTALFAGMIELTNGVKQMSMISCRAISINIILSAFLLGFGGISVLLQVYSITSKTDISIKAYFIGKLLQGIFAAIYTFLFIMWFPIFNLNL